MAPVMAPALLPKEATEEQVSDRGSRAAGHDTLQVAPSTPQSTPPPAPPVGDQTPLSTLWGIRTGLLALDWLSPCPSGPVRIRGQGRAVMRSGVSGRSWASLGLERAGGERLGNRGSKLLPDGQGPPTCMPPRFPMGKAGSCPSQGPGCGWEREAGCKGWSGRLG